MTKKQIFTIGHSIAKEIQSDENIKSYRECFARGLKLAWANYNQMKAAKNATKKMRALILNNVCKNGSLFMDYSDKFGPNPAKKEKAYNVSKFAYKYWYVSGGLQMFFSPQVIEILNN